MNKAESYDDYPVKQYGKITPRDYQQAAIDKAIEHCKTSSDPAVLDISVGGGKTILVGALSKHVTDKGGKVMMLTRQSIIVAQNAVDSWLCRCRTSEYSAGLGKKSAAYDCIFGSEGTVYNALKKDIDFKNGESQEPSELSHFVPDLLLIDECHHYDWTNDECQYSFIIKELYTRNPKLKVIGLTGTSYRSTTPIIGESDDYFWKKKLIDISTEYLTDRGFLVPVDFGFSHDDVGYDLSEFKSTGEDGVREFTKAEMEAMEAKILKADTTTEKIIIEVVERTKRRNGVMICVSGKKHMKEACKYLPKGSYACITDDTPERKRNKLLQEVYDGKRKFILQISALSTGYNAPILDTLVIMRKYCSLTLLVQTVGRVLRLLKPEQEAAGIIKERALVLDYTDTFRELGDLYHNPMLEEAEFKKAEEENKLIECPKCGTSNSMRAHRCRGINHNGERCDFFWNSKICEPFYVNGKLIDSGCGSQNSPSARQCRICGNTLIDHNAKLLNKAYTENDYIPLTKFEMKPTQNGGVAVEYHLVTGDIAREFFPNAWDKANPKHTIIKRMLNNNLIKKLFQKEHQSKAYRARNAGELCSYAGLINIEAITHRKSGTKDIVSKVLHKIK